MVISLVCAVAHADSDPPWAAGVSVEKRAQADQIFREGNELFAQQAWTAALDKYEQAVALVDHPLIRFNMAVALIRLDRLLEASEQLERALRYGDSPFSPELYQQARDYRSLVDGRVGSIEASCDQPGTRITLDGKPWFESPGTKKERTLAGVHRLVAERAGYLTISREVVVTGGNVAQAKLRLVPLDSAVTFQYPYDRWIPYSITGGGAALALAGLGVWLSGRSAMDRYESDFRRDCPDGCAANLADNQTLAGERDKAELKGEIGATMMIAGGAVTIGGVIFTVLDRPRRVLPKIEVAPTPGGAALSTTLRF